MREINDFYTVALDKLYDDDKTESGIIKVNQAWIDPEEETRFQYKRMYGTVISGPLGFSQMTSGDYNPIGIPEPKAYVSSDMIQSRVNQGDRNWSRDDYSPSTFEGYQMVTLKDYAKRVDVRQNELIYFDEMVTERENFLGMSDGKLLYRCRVDHIICCIRDGVIKTQGTWVLIEPVMETWEEITSPAGVIMKVAPEGKPLRGIVKYGMCKGKEIIYIPDSNWGVTIEGEEYFGIREKEILCVIKKQPSAGS